MTPLLIIGCFVAAFVSGITGMAGGTLILSILLLFFEPLECIAIHGFLQVIANITRVGVFWKSVNWRSFAYFVGLVLPGAWLGMRLSTQFNPNLLKVVLGLVILWVAWKPTKKTKVVSQKRPFIFVPLGFLSGFLGMIIGVTGPLLAPFFLQAGLLKETFIATKAICQFVVQIVKVVLFATLLQFDYTHFFGELIFMSGAIVIGTIVAKITLKRIPTNIFVSLLKLILTTIAIRLTWEGIINLFE